MEDKETGKIYLVGKVKLEKADIDKWRNKPIMWEGIREFLRKRVKWTILEHTWWKYKDWKFERLLKKHPEIQKMLDKKVDELDRFLAFGNDSPSEIEPQAKDKILYDNLKGDVV